MDAAEETAQDVLARFDRIVIVAGPGMGKSTLLRYLTRDLANGTMSQTYPILVSLGAYVADEGHHDLLSFAVRDRYAAVLAREELQQLDDVVRAWNREGRLLFLLDGLNEVAEDRRRLLWMRSSASSGSSWRLDPSLRCHSTKKLARRSSSAR